MELFKDKKQALEELDQLLQAESEELETEDFDDEDFDEEELDEEEFVDEDEAQQISTGIYQNYANGYGKRIYNADHTDTDLDDYSDQVYESRSNSDIKRLTAIAIVLTAAIVGVVIWWLSRYL